VASRDKVLKIVRELKLVRPRDLERQGIRPNVLWKLAKEGQVERIGRGLYQLPGTVLSEYVSLLEVVKAVPNSIICLLTALRFHEIGTQEPPRVWIAIDRKARKPKSRTVEMEIVRFSGVARVKGVETHRIDGFSIRVTNPGRTVADCFKYRNKIGLDVALEALRECLMDNKATIDQLWHFAGVCRVQNVMRPYLEALTS
jgi:predicted transcriptional regulator of viral defense system